MRNVTVGPFRPWLVPESQAEREALAARPHDPDAAPCWCQACQDRRGQRRIGQGRPVPGVDVGYGPYSARGVNPSK